MTRNIFQPLSLQLNIRMLSNHSLTFLSMYGVTIAHTSPLFPPSQGFRTRHRDPTARAGVQVLCLFKILLSSSLPLYIPILKDLASCYLMSTSLACAIVHESLLNFPIPKTPINTKFSPVCKKSPKKNTGWNQSGEGIRNCTKPCWVSKLIIIIIKKNSNTQF